MAAEPVLVSLDAVPTPLLLVLDCGRVVPNRAACRLFGVDDASGCETAPSFLHLASLLGAEPGALQCVELTGPDGAQLFLEIAPGEPVPGSPGRVMLLRDTSEEVVGRRGLERRIQFERLLTEASASLMRSTGDGLDGTIGELLGAVGRFFGVDRAYVFLIDVGRSTQSNTHEWVAPGISREADNLQGLPLTTFPWMIERLRHDEAFVVDAVEDMPVEAIAERAEFDREGIQSILIVPIWVGDGLYGYVGFDAVRSRVRWDEPYVVGLRLMAQMLAGALEGRSLARRLRMQAMHDPLTGLPNRLFLEDRFESCTRRLPQARLDRLLAAVVDVDDFKLVNDGYGHAEGDALLREVATRLRAAVGEEAVVARIGGDEFVVFEASGREDEEAFGRRILAVADEAFAVGGEALGIGLSIGVACNQPGNRQLEALLRRADAAMYRAKAGGKNRWSIAGDPVPVEGALDAVEA